MAALASGDLVLIVVLAVVLSLVTSILMLVYRQSKNKEYDDTLHRAELGRMREYFESQMNALTNRLLSTEERWRDVNHLVISSMQKADERPTNRYETRQSGFLEAFGITASQLVVEKDLVFVLSPFHKQFSGTFETIRAACVDTGLRCFRGDEQYIGGDLFPHILSFIVRARVVIANIDGRNPNVMYELGVAHALDKATIVVAKHAPKIPIDLRTRKIVIWADEAELKRKLQIELARTLASAG
jgi:hypothetical protein